MMKTIVAVALGVTILFTFAAPPSPLEAQIWKRVKEAAKSTVEREAEQKTEEAVLEGIDKAGEVVVCLVTDQACMEQAEEEGKKVTVKDEAGNTVAEAAAPEAAAAAAARPGEGVWANYDFVPGETVIFATDFTEDNVGDFPRRLEFVRGNWEIAEWQGQRLLRHTGPRHAVAKIPLPDALPERFTIEFDAYFPHGNQQLAVLTSEPETGNLHAGYDHNFFLVDGRGSGVEHRQRDAVKSTNTARQVNEGLVPIRIMVDGQYAKMYIGEQRVANVPNADIARSRTIWLQDTNFADQENPMYIGSIRVAAGGRDLYDVLAEKGRVATQGIYFDTGSDRIRPESTPTLKEIGNMLNQHPDLKLVIEGHTDNVGEDAANQSLSQRRAAAVKQHLIAEYGIDLSRLEAKGLGESQPAADNSTAEGRQQNRRVELVRVG